MLTANDIKRLNCLKSKSTRDELGVFPVEGDRAINELRNAGLIPVEYYSTEDGTIGEKQIERISSLKTPQGSFAVFRKPFAKFEKIPENSISIVLDSIQDPGNLGTIIRTCDWFGISNIYASLKTADCYNPKVIQATMGAIARVKVFYTDLVSLLSDTSIPVYGTFMDDSENIYRTRLPNNGAILVLGNEGNGISPEIERLISRRITIPSFSQKHVESLNVSIAAAIAISEFKRHQ